MPVSEGAGNGVPLSEDHVAAWKVIAFTVRTCQLALERAVDPYPTSMLAFADLHYPSEKVSTWSREYLRAAAEHLCFWADSVAPYNFDPAAVNNVTAGYRPYLLLGRAGLESAAHAMWLLTSPGAQECARRHVRLMHRDFTYHAEALEAGRRDSTQLKGRRDELKARAQEIHPSLRPADKPPGYENLVKLAAEALERDAEEWAYLWNAASGAAHGQNWFTVEGFQVIAKTEYEQGHFRITRIPDPEFITTTLSAAATALEGGTVLWLKLGGYPDESYLQAAHTVYERTPKKP